MAAKGDRFSVTFGDRLKNANPPSFNGKPQATASVDDPNTVACGLPLNEIADYQRSFVPLIELTDVCKTYDLGEVQVRRWSRRT